VDPDRDTDLDPAFQVGFDEQKVIKICNSLILEVHKHEIILNFFIPKSNPYMPLVNSRKKFASFPSIFARISKFEHC
jgi:hypothetical protein